MDKNAKDIGKPVVAVVGSTATGKTALAVEIARLLKSEVISADSQVIYRELNIGTAKPTEAEKKCIPHQMIDVAAPDENFSVAMYQEQATQHLERLWGAGMIPVVAGGTGFYIQALLQAEFIPDVPPNEGFRKTMLELAEQSGPHKLHELLSEKDPVRAAALHPNDSFRVIRALEIIQATGRPVPNRSEDKGLSILWVGLTYHDRDLLRTRIDHRIDAMLEAGWLAEVESLAMCYGPNAHALNVAHGYPELVQVVQGQRTLEDAVAQIQINVHQYARRQMTWFRRNKDIAWTECDKTDFEAQLQNVQTRLKECAWLSL